MASLILAFAASMLLVQALPANAAMQQMMTSGGMSQNMGGMHGFSAGTVSWQIDITAFFQYTGAAQRTSMLQQILQLWKSSFDASSQLSNEKVTFISEQAVPGFPGYKQVSFRITGNSPAGTDVNSLVAQFTTILQGANIPGVQTTLSGSTSGSGSGIISGGGNVGSTVTVQIDVQADMQYSSSAQRDQILQQVLAMFQSSFGSQGFKNLKISVVSETPSVNIQGGKTLSFRITGQTSGNVDMNSISQQFMQILSSATIPGFTVVQQTQQTGGGVITVPIGGGGSSTVTVQIDVQADMQYSSAAQRDKILQQVLAMFQSNFGSQGFKNLKISVVSETPSANIQGGKTLSFRITGQTSGNVDMNSISQQFIQILSSATIPGFTVNQQTQQIGGGVITIPIGGGGSTSGNGVINWEIEVNGVFQYANSAARDKILQQILALWTKNFGSQTGFNNQKVTVVSEGAGPMPGTFQLHFKITGSSKPNVDIQSLIQSFIPILLNAQITGVQSLTPVGPDNGGGSSTTIINGGGSTIINGGGSSNINGGGSTTINGGGSSNINGGGSTTINGGGSTDINGGGNGNNGGGGENVFDGNVIITYKTQADLDKIMNQILQLWIQTYSIPGAHITVVTKRPTGNGKFTITYKITYNSETPVMTTETDFNNIIHGNNIPNVEVPDNGGGNGGGQTNGGGQINGGGQTSGGGGNQPFTFNGNLIVSYKTQADLDRIMNQILQLWIKTYTTTWNVSPGATITVVTKRPAGNGQFTITYKITGTSGTPVDTTDSNFNNIISNNNINGVQIPNGGGSVNGGGQGSSNEGGKDITNGEGNAGGTGTPFTIENTVVIQTSNTGDINGYLQKILALWIQTYSKQYSISGQKIVQVTFSSVTPGSITVTYRITGFSAQPIDVDQNNSQFNQLISSGKVTGVTVSGGGSSTGGGSGTGNGQSFSIDNTVVIKTSNTDDIDGYLQKILALWFQTYNKQYTISGQKISHDSVSSVNPGYITVTYRITGFSVQPIDVDQNNADFNKIIASGKITGVSLTAGGATTGTTDNNNANNGGGNFAVSENQQNGKDIPPGNFDVTLTVYLSYRTPAERDNFLQRLLVIWRNTLNDYQVTGLKISFVKETLNVGTLPLDLGGGPVNKVWYRLTGGTVLSFNTAVVSKTFEETVVAAHLGGVEFSLGGGSSAGGASAQGNANAGGSTAQTQTPEGDAGAMLGGGGGAFSIPGTVKLTYKTTQQRDTFLSQIMVMWRNAIWSYQVSDVKIKMTGESGSGPTKVVSYVITGISALPINLNEARNTFKTTLIESHLTGVQYA